MKNEHRANSSFILNALSEGVRLDGRSVKDYRKLTFFFGKQYGQVEVNLGKTSIFCALSAEMIEPFPDRPNEGFFNIHIDSQSSGVLSDGETNFSEVIELTAIIERLIKGCRAIDVESLCILGARKVWSVRMDLRILNNDGNLRDSCSIAALAGISHFRLPEIEFDLNNELIEISSESREPIPLCVHHLPFLITLGQFKEHGNLLIVDPLLSEETLMNGRISVAINQFGELCGLYKPGGQEIDFSLLSYAVEVASKTAKQFVQDFQKALKLDQEFRDRARKNVHLKYSSSPIQIPLFPHLFRHVNTYLDMPYEVGGVTNLNKFDAKLLSSTWAISMNSQTPQVSKDTYNSQFIDTQESTISSSEIAHTFSDPLPSDCNKQTSLENLLIKPLVNFESEDRSTSTHESFAKLQTMTLDSSKIYQEPQDQNEATGSSEAPSSEVGIKERDNDLAEDEAFEAAILNPPKKNRRIKQFKKGSK